MIKKKIIDVLPFIKDTSKIIEVNRTISRGHLSIIDGLKDRIDILIINDNVETTMDLAVTFYKLDIKNKNFLPYNPNHDYGDIEFAITARESHLVPTNMKFLDIGYRPIDISSIFEILGQLNVPIEDFQDELENYHDKYMNLYKKSEKRMNLTRKVERLNKALKKDASERGFVTKHTFESIMTNSNEMKNKIKKAKKLAMHDINVLICGESGTGKELFAQAIHCESPRKNSPFIGVNVTAIPANLLESELFGYIDGAFTGAKKSGHKGLFEQCGGGTLFLDEIGDMKLEMQGKILRVLEERCIMPIGGSKLIDIDVRIVAATNKNLLKEISLGNFREDLYYRLKSSIINIPPLRDRADDILPLAKRFLPEKLVFDNEVKCRFLNYKWLGNIRELKNACNYIEIMAESNTVCISDIPEDIVLDFDICSEKINLSSVGTSIGEIIDNNSINDNFKDSPQIYANSEKIKLIIESILEITSSSSSAGRKSIMEHLSKQDISIGEGELKRILVDLRESGYIIQFKGRKGSVVTKLGEELVKRN